MPNQTNHRSRVDDEHSFDTANRGPDDILQQATAALRRQGRVSLVHVKLELADNTVLLRGSVPSYYVKQVAQECMRSVAEEFQLSVCNLLDVNPALSADDLGAG